MMMTTATIMIVFTQLPLAKNVLKEPETKCAFYAALHSGDAVSLWQPCSYWTTITRSTSGRDGGQLRRRRRLTMFEPHLQRRGFWLTEDAQCKQCFSIAEVTVIIIWLNTLSMSFVHCTSCGLRFFNLNLSDIDIVKPKIPQIACRHYTSKALSF